VTMLPTVAATTTGAQLADAFRERRDNRLRVNGFSEGPMVEIVRESPNVGWVRGLSGGEDLLFDAPTDSEAALRRRTLEIRMVAWYYMRIPFADWVLNRMFLAHFKLKRYTAANPLMPVQKNAGGWDEDGVALPSDSWPGGDLGERMVQWSEQGHFLFPIQVHAAMRMMTPVKAINFQGGAACGLHSF
jgi:hypothetical protein